jgi:hypothetical protein
MRQRARPLIFSSRIDVDRAELRMSSSKKYSEIPIQRIYPVESRVGRDGRPYKSSSSIYGRVFGIHRVESSRFMKLTGENEMFRIQK